MKDYFKAIYALANKCVVKVLKINLKTGEYKILHLNKGENTSTSPLLEDWVKESIENELIHPDYADAVKHIINIDYITKTLVYRRYIHLKLKRKPCKNVDYENNVISIVPTLENKDEVFLVLYNIEES